jgi:hypothetical protein
MGHGDLVSGLVLALASLPTSYLEPWMRDIVTEDIAPLVAAA